MLLCVPNEIYPGEARVARMPAGIQTLRHAGFEVLVQEGAGNEAHLDDDEYRSAGSSIAPTAASLDEQADLILKGRQPLDSGLPLLKDGSTLSCMLDAWFN